MLEVVGDRERAVQFRFTYGSVAVHLRFSFGSVRFTYGSVKVQFRRNRAAQKFIFSRKKIVSPIFSVLAEYKFNS